MNDFGRFMKEFNTNMQQMVQTMNQMQGLYKSIAQLSPIWKEMYTSLQAQAQEQQQPIDQVNRSHAAGRRNAPQKGTIPNRRNGSK
ncbi:MAG: hypothetical protein WD424_08300 [Paenibacillaceae bacterium]